MTRFETNWLLFRRWATAPFGLFLAPWTPERCDACGGRTFLTRKNVLSEKLIGEWELTPEWVEFINRREGVCCFRCECSWRSRHLARSIVQIANAQLNLQAHSLREMCREPRFREWKIAEINSAEKLHPFLCALPNLAFSEYGSAAPAVPSEDLMKLSYADEVFDLVVTSESLEHVPDVVQGLRETLRVLKPGGYHVFTVPMVGYRPTRQRAKIENGKLIHLLPPSHHGRPSEQQGARSDMLVFCEPGSDFAEYCLQAGFYVTTHGDPRNPAVVTFLGRRPV